MMSLLIHDDQLPESKQARVLIIDDEIGSRLSLWIALKDNYDTVPASSAKEGLQLIEQSAPFDVILVDYKMPESSGLDFLRELRQRDPQISVAMISAHASLESATGAMRLEAFDYVEKPFEEQHLREVVARGARRTMERRSSVARDDLEQTAAAIIHDLATPITTVAFAADEVAEKLGPDSADALKESAARCQQLIDIWHNRLQSKKEMAWFALGDLIDELQKQLAQQNSPVRIKFSTFSRALEIWTDRNQFLRIFDNLIRNAAYAVLHSEAGLAGGIAIAVKPDKLTSTVNIEVKDTGCGMSPSTADQAFTPYFSTKGKRGTGLGLPICKRLVTEMKGKISLQSQEGRGTVVQVTLKSRES